VNDTIEIVTGGLEYLFVYMLLELWQ